MDGSRFDEIARAFGRRGSRRAAIVATAALAGARFARPRAAAGQVSGALRLGDICTYHDDCTPVSPDAGWATCRSNGAGIARPSCCLVKGSWCNFDWECCDGESCSIVCGGVAASGLRPGSWCPAGGDLCSTHHVLGLVSPVCADNGIWEDGPTNCCFPAGSLSGNDAQCCAGLFCAGGTCA